MVILEESVSRFHAEISFEKNEFYLRDIGSTTGTFIKIMGILMLEEDMIIEMGSNQFLVESIGYCNQGGELVLKVLEGPDQGKEYRVPLKDKASNYTVGRKCTNMLSFDDQHLSNIHAKIFLLDNKYTFEDMGSTNG
jgi:pSer/pThr/pTyr-binding forkhead associated (FHA) protein